MDVVAKPVQPATPAVIWGEIAAQHTRKEKAAEETKILAMSKKENENESGKRDQPRWISDEHGWSLMRGGRS
jgi:hypothetical protein